VHIKAQILSCKCLVLILHRLYDALIHTPSVHKKMSQLCQNLDVFRLILISRYIQICSKLSIILWTEGVLNTAMLQFLHFSRTHEQFVHTELTRNWNNEIHLVTLHHYKCLFFNNENIISTHPVTIQYPESFNDGTSLPMIYFIYTSIVTRRITKQSYLGYKTVAVHLSTSSLVSILRSIQALLVIPPSHPWLTRC
jgi:hypothetical protein